MKNKGSQMTEEEETDYNYKVGQKPLLQIEEAINKRLFSVKKNIYEIGRLLHKAKDILYHGGYERWIKEKFGGQLSLSTALNCRRIYETFQHREDIVKALPAAALISLIRKEPKDSELAEIDKLLQEGLTEEQLKQNYDDLKAKRGEKAGKKSQLEVIADKYKEESRVKGYDWVLYHMLAEMKYARRVKHNYNGFVSAMQFLLDDDTPYIPYKTLVLLKVIQAEGFIEEIDKALDTLNQTKKAFIKCLDHFQEVVEDGQKIKTKKLVASNP